MNRTAAVVAAPALMTGYGLVRLAYQRWHHPWEWPVGHLLMLGGLGCFAVVLAELRRRVPGRWSASCAWLAAAGLAALAVQFTIDVVIGAMAPPGPDRQHYFSVVQAIPGVRPVVYSVVPLLFQCGLLALTVVATVRPPRPLPWWSPVLVLLASALAGVSLDLIPMAGMLYLLGLWPLTRARPTTAATQPEAGKVRADAG